MIEKYNYKINKEINPGDGLLNGQDCGKLATCRYGFFPMSYNGCEIIAAYNFRMLLGIPEPLCEIAKEIYPYGNWLSGVFGTKPSALGRYCKDNNIPVTKYKDYYAFRENFKQKKYAVITFWNADTIFKGIHTVCIENITEGINIYNKTNKSQYAVVTETLDHYMDAGRFICGYVAD